MKTIFTIIGLSILVIASYLFLRNISKEIELTDTKKPTKQIALGTNVFLSYFDENNNLKYQMKSSKVAEFNNDKATELYNPKLKSFAKNKQIQWKAKSDNASISADKNIIKLWDNIKLTQDPNSKNPINVISKTMLYNAKTNLVTSSDPVVIFDKTSKQNANNFKLNVKTKKLNFKEKIRARFSTKTN